MNNSEPLISIITATYNRSNVLAFAIKSVINSTYKNWELLVIGDACTDDSETVVKSFADPRIHFINLEKNFGEQSYPNNKGCEIAKGEYIAFLNHDDLWFPDHLQVLLDGIISSGADLVFPLCYLPRRNYPYLLTCACPSGYYEPQVIVPVSCWLFKKNLLKENGYWRSYKECYNAPSQDWLFRAHRAGKKLKLIKKVTVILIQSDLRKEAYKNRDVFENQDFYEKMTTDVFLREKIMTEVAFTTMAFLNEVKWQPYFIKALKKLALKLVIKLKIHPLAFKVFFKYGKKGKFIDHLRKVRGLGKK